MELLNKLTEVILKIDELETNLNELNQEKIKLIQEIYNKKKKSFKEINYLKSNIKTKDNEDESEILLSTEESD